MENYIIAIVAIVIAFLLIKRFVGCVFRIIVTLILCAILAYCYFSLRS
ncbi:MAG: hypothetical protein IKO28_03600 [Prevotella sp.]|nr:hypothetical protein [Prevotella sp.]MBR4650706.1 hypothetical protein [Prevotella sp.]